LGERAGFARRSPAKNGKEGEIEIARTPDSAFEGLPDYRFSPHYVDLDGLRMHYVAEGPRTGPVVLMVHGFPTWTYLFRHVIPPVAAAGHRVVAPDLIGFGRSDKPTSTDDYSYLQHQRWLEAFLEVTGLEDITLVAHDWGGLVALPIAARRQDLFARLAILDTSLNTGEERAQGVGSPRYWQGFAAWRAYTLSDPRFRPGAILRRQTIRELTPAEEAAYDAPYPERRYLAALRINDSLYPLDPDAEGAEENRAARRAFQSWRKPVLLVFSGRAGRSHPGQDQMFRELFAGAIWRDVRMDQAGHFSPEDCPEELAALLLDFLGSA
jgi:haloalkane dehalogenase